MVLSNRHLLGISELVEAIHFEKSVKLNDFTKPLIELLEGLDDLIAKDDFAASALKSRQTAKLQKSKERAKDGFKDRGAPIPFDIYKLIPPNAHSSLKQCPVCGHDAVVTMWTSKLKNEGTNTATKID